MNAKGLVRQETPIREAEADIEWEREEGQGETLPDELEQTSSGHLALH